MHFFAALLLLCSSSFAATENRQPPKGETPYAFYLDASRSAEGASTNVRLEVISGDIYALRVYSEPSHTLLAAYADNQNGDPRQAQWWREIFPTQVAVARGPLRPGAKFLQQGPIASETDKKIAVHMFGIFPGEETPQDRVVAVATDPWDFRFTLKRYSTMTEFCCDLNPDQCGGGCVFCGPGGSEFRCCKYHTGSPCGWCKDVHRMPGGKLP